MIAVDGSPSMVEKVKEVLRPQDTAFVSDLTKLELDEHGRRRLLDRRLPLDHRPRGALRPDARRPQRRRPLRRPVRRRGQHRRIPPGRGGGRRARAVRAHLSATGFEKPWNYAGAGGDRSAPARGGLRRRAVWLQPWPVHPPRARATSCARCLGAHVERLPEDLHEQLRRRRPRRPAEPLRLDYVASTSKPRQRK